MTKRTAGKVEMDPSPNNKQEEDDKSQSQSASAAFGCASKNHHVDNPYPPNKQKKVRIQKAATIKSVRTLTAAATPMAINHPSDHSLRCRVEIDSRADTTCAGAAFKLIDKSVSRVTDVGGFHPDMPEMKNIPIGTAVTAFDLAHVQDTVMLVFHEALYLGKGMKESLINPNQLHHNGIVFDTCPKQFSG
jgi:hypothetical protein